MNENLSKRGLTNGLLLGLCFCLGIVAAGTWSGSHTTWNTLFSNDSEMLSRIEQLEGMQYYFKTRQEYIVTFLGLDVDSKLWPIERLMDE